MIKKAISVISGLIGAGILVSFFVNAYKYEQKYNIWAERDDRGLTGIIAVVVVLVVVVFFMIVFPAKKKANTIAAGKQLNPEAVKKCNLSSIFGSILAILFFCIVSNEMVFEFMVDALDMNFAEGTFMVGHYKIFEKHFLIFNIVVLISSIIDYLLTETAPVHTNYITYNNDSIQNSAVQNNSLGSVKICPYCKAEITDEMLFCGNCGNKVR